MKYNKSVKLYNSPRDVLKKNVFRSAREFPLNNISQFTRSKTKIKILVNNFYFYWITIALFYKTIEIINRFTT
jgi:hypothetical protein